MKVMLVCNAGMSTGILAKRIEEASNGKVICKAYGEAEYVDHVDEGYELLLKKICKLVHKYPLKITNYIVFLTVQKSLFRS